MSDTSQVLTLHHTEDTVMNLNVTAIPIVRYGIPSFKYTVSVPYGKKDDEYQFIKELVFHVGNPAKYGINGLTNETLMAIMIHRLTGFQENPISNCIENQDAIDHLSKALEAMQKRTRRLLTK